MKAEDPEAYAQMTNMVFRGVSRSVSRANARLAYLESRPVDSMTPEEQANHARLQEAIARTAEIQAKMVDETLTGEQREELGREMFESQRTVAELEVLERGALMSSALAKAGLSRENAESAAAEIEEIYRNTQSRGGPGGGGFPPPGGFGGRPGR